MRSEYDHTRIETEMQERWCTEGLYTTPQTPDQHKRYVLDMFPYPSGEGLHVGHVVGYTATDIYARYMRMRGFDVLHPMGWDAFGLPAENYAVKTGVHPYERTKETTDKFREQIKGLGLSYDWDREINTSSPDYYRWTQWIFLLLFKNGLAYKKEAAVNWCPDCQTVLANEQVVEGECERCHEKVIQKELKQWFFNITKYADELIEGLDDIDWPESTKQAQKNWIGRSEGAELQFPLNKKHRFVIIHGYASGPEKHFIPWLTERLRARGHEVEVPKLPSAEDPNISEQIKYVQENVSFDERTIVIAHSLGGPVALKALEGTQTKIHKLVLAGGFIDTEINTDRGYFDSFDWSFDFETIREHVNDIVIIRDEHDDAIPAEQADKIHRKLGAMIVDTEAQKPHFRADTEPAVLKHSLPALSVFTTRPDTLYGATYMVIAPEHPLIEAYETSIENLKEVRSYVEETRHKTELERSTDEREKTGVEIKGLRAINPATKEDIPLYVADYVLATYGSGAIMAVPAHDERDHEFAQKHLLEIREVISGEGDLPRAETGTLVNSGEFSGLTSEEAQEKITAAVGGEMKVTYRLRDWLVSRQRYWGAPIPIVYDPEGRPHPVPEKHLPWELPTDVDYQPHGTAPLGSSQKLKERTEQIFGKGWAPEIDTMDTFVDSSWYFVRFTDPLNADSFADPEKAESWMPVDVYVGGAEHTVLHLMYARFFTKVLRDMGHLSTSEPFQTLRHPGTILGPDGDKMSKSKGNIISPDDMISRFGADTLRMYEMFMGPFDQAKAWDVDNMVGVRRFLERVWRIHEMVSDEAILKRSRIAQTIQKVGHDIEHFKFNTAISALMVLSNTFEKEGVTKSDFEDFLLLLAPFAPHIADHLWREHGHEQSIHLEQWPSFSQEEIQEEYVRIVVQIDGKVRANIELPPQATREDIETAAREREEIQRWLEKVDIEKTIVVPGKLINFVTKAQ